MNNVLRLGVAEFVTINFQLKIKMMRNKNIIEPQNPQCVQTIVMPSAFVLKKCSGCNLDLEANLNNFNAMKRGKYGLRSKCKKCCVEYRKEYMKRPDAKESHRIRQQKWRDENPEEQLKRSREQLKKFGQIYNANAKEKYNSNQEYRLKKLEKDKQYNSTGRRKQLYRVPKNLEYNLNRNKIYRSKNIEKVKEQQQKYIEKLPDTLIKIRLGFKKKDEIPKEIIETKRLTILLKRTLKNN